VSAVAVTVDTPPALTAVPVATRRGGGPCAEAVAARLERGRLRVSLRDGVEVVRAARWLRAEGDGRAPVDVILRPGGREITVTWRDGRRRRFEVAWLRAGRRS
jgi:hypothetical protein